MVGGGGMVKLGAGRLTIYLEISRWPRVAGVAVVVASVGVVCRGGVFWRLGVATGESPTGRFLGGVFPLSGEFVSCK